MPSHQSVGLILLGMSLNPINGLSTVFLGYVIVLNSVINMA